ncbi:MAG: peptide chain release factor N(5)-glutamine methyltransferase, partial [Chloroflexota bacterium]
MGAEEIWTPLKLIEWTSVHFAKRGVDSPRLDAEVLLAHALDTTRVALYTAFDKPVSAAELVRYRELVRRRANREPLAYLVGHREFWSLSIAVDPSVLIPRPATETLVEAALKLARAAGAARLGDVATGSGAIVAALAKELSDARFVASDSCAAALAVAKKNLDALGLSARVDLVHGDLLEPMVPHAPFDLLVANPPYVPSAEIPTLEPEVWAEPKIALDGGADGLDVLRRLIPGSKNLL